MSQENVEVVQAFLDAIGRGDERAAMRRLATEVEWHMFPAGVGGEVFHGPHDVRDAGLASLSAWEKAELQVPEVIDAGDAVVVRVRWRLRGRASGLETRRNTPPSATSATEGSFTTASTRTGRRPSKPWGCGSSPSHL